MTDSEIRNRISELKSKRTDLTYELETIDREINNIRSNHNCDGHTKSEMGYHTSESHCTICGATV